MTAYSIRMGVPDLISGSSERAGSGDSSDGGGITRVGSAVVIGATFGVTTTGSGSRLGPPSTGVGVGSGTGLVPSGVTSPYSANEVLRVKGRSGKGGGVADGRLR